MLLLLLILLCVVDGILGLNRKMLLFRGINGVGGVGSGFFGLLLLFFVCGSVMVVVVCWLGWLMVDG